ncbi:MAG: TetR/AcrR family transcriptional regulator [Solirubrobacterales bacterium]
MTSARERILRVSIERFSSQGFGGTGVREIADLATLNVASIYHHFPSKEEILLAIIEETFIAAHEPAKRIVEETTDPARALVALTKHHIAVHCERAAETAISDRELGSLTPEGRRRALELRDAYEKLWDDLLRLGQNRGVFHIEDVELVRIAVLTMCSQVATWYRPEGRVTVDQIANLYARLVLRLVAYRSSADAKR